MKGGEEGGSKEGGWIESSKKEGRGGSVFGLLIH